MFSFDLIQHTKRQKNFSWRTFGPPQNEYGSHDNVAGVLDHIDKELSELEEAPDREARRLEWIDVIILAIDGYIRDGGSPMQLCLDLGHKQVVNEKRKWPDWRTAEPGKAIEHIREDVYPWIGKVENEEIT